MVERQYHMHETPNGLIKQANGIGNRRATRVSRTVDGRRIAVERVEINRLAAIQECIPGSIIDLQHVIHGLDDKAIARTKRLIGRLNGKLIATVGEPLVMEV